MSDLNPHHFTLHFGSEIGRATRMLSPIGGRPAAYSFIMLSSVCDLPLSHPADSPHSSWAGPCTAASMQPLDLKRFAAFAAVASATSEVCEAGVACGAAPRISSTHVSKNSSEFSSK